MIILTISTKMISFWLKNRKLLTWFLNTQTSLSVRIGFHFLEEQFSLGFLYADTRAVKFLEFIVRSFLSIKIHKESGENGNTFDIQIQYRPISLRCVSFIKAKLSLSPRWKSWIVHRHNYEHTNQFSTLHLRFCLVKFHSQRATPFTVSFKMMEKPQMIPHL